VLSMCYPYVIHVLSMCYPCVIHVLSECYSCVIHVLSMCYICVIHVLSCMWVVYLLSMCYPCVIDVLSICHPGVIYVLPICYACVIHVSSECYSCVTCCLNLCMLHGRLMTIMHVHCVSLCLLSRAAGLHATVAKTFEWMAFLRTCAYGSDGCVILGARWDNCFAVDVASFRPEVIWLEAYE